MLPHVERHHVSFHTPCSGAELFKAHILQLGKNPFTVSLTDYHPTSSDEKPIVHLN